MTFPEFETAYWTMRADVQLLRGLQPENGLEQKQRFFRALDARTPVNPRFRYPALDAPLSMVNRPIADVSRMLRSFNGHPLHDAYRQLVSKLTESIDLMRMNRSDPRFRGLLTDIWGIPTEQEVAEAKAFLRASTEPIPPNRMNDVSASALADRLRTSLTWAAGDWTIEEDENLSARISVSPLRKRIRIRANTMFSEDDVRRYVVHEIGVHVTRYENGACQPFLLFRHGFPHYLPTEEGLAVYAEEQAGVSDGDVMRTYAGRLVAASIAARGSFLDVYHQLIEWFDPSQAFEIAQRVKRGLEDTSEPGGWTKDLVYFCGYRSVHQHLADGGDVRSLWIGKVGLEDLDLVDEMVDQGMIRPPTHLPAFV